MKNKIVIKPSKPIVVKGILGCMIKLNKNQVNYGDLKLRKELMGFREQTNRHITIVGDKTLLLIEKALNRFSVLERKKKVAKLKFISKNLKWEYKQKGIYFIEKKKYFGNPKILEHRKSYIRLVDMPDIYIFYQKLNFLLETHIPVQFSHITLFTKGEHSSREYFGISISSKTEFKKLHPKKIKA